MSCSSESSISGDGMILADMPEVSFSSSDSSSSESETVVARSLNWAISQSRYIANQIDGIRVRIEITSAEGLSPKIFAYLTLPMKPATLDRVGAFDHVCSPVDLEEYPEDEPLPTHSPEWFRLAYVDVHIRSVHETERFIELVLLDMQALVDTLNIMDTLLPTQEGTIS